MSQHSAHRIESPLRATRNLTERQFGQDPLRAGTPPPAGATTSRASKSARKRQSSTDELSEVEEVVGKKKKAKKAPKVKMDKVSYPGAGLVTGDASELTV